MSRALNAKLTLRLSCTDIGVQIRDLSSLLVDGYRMEKPELANSEM